MYHHRSILHMAAGFTRAVHGPFRHVRRRNLSSWRSNRITSPRASASARNSLTSKRPRETGLSAVASHHAGPAKGWLLGVVHERPAVWRVRNGFLLIEDFDIDSS